jgi:hypothetical protein
MRDENSCRNRILLGQLISNGDCLYATAIAQQIKRDFPGCHLTWAVSSFCRKIIEENPFIDEIWEIPLPTWSYELLPANWVYFENEALRRYDEGVYDFVFFTQIYPGNPHHFEGTVRPGIFLGYPGKITVPIRPSLVLRAEEVERVTTFAKQHRLRDFEQVILFECSSKSGQTHVTLEFALQAAETIANTSAGRHAVILSSQQAVQSSVEGIIDGSVLTLREMAELTKHCTLLIGCSSGVSCVATSTWAKSLPMIQMLTNRCAMFASLAHDYLYFGLPTSHVIEMFDADVERLVSCFNSFLQKGWTETKRVYHQEPQIAFTYYLDFVRDFVLKAYDYYGFCVSLRHTVDRYGWHQDLDAAVRQFAKTILPQSAVGREIVPDALLSKLMRPARALSSAAIGVLGYDPPSTRAETCLLSLRRNKLELERILGATGDFASNDREFSQLIAALLGPAPKEQLAVLQANNPEKKWFHVATVLALIQQAEYMDAQQELIRDKKLSQSWNPYLEEILGDLNWMRGYHSEALAGYQEAFRNRPNDLSLQKKIDRLVIRCYGKLTTTKSEVSLKDLGLVFYPAQPIDASGRGTLLQSQLQAASSFGLETAYLQASEDNSKKAWSLLGQDELQQTDSELLFSCQKNLPNSKKLIEESSEWARRKGKRWIALTALDSIITTSFLRELEGHLAQAPTVLIVSSWDIPGTVRRAAGLILVRVDWWEKNRRRFVGYNLRKTDWIARYAKKISKFSKAAYLVDPEQRILTIQALSFLAAAFTQPNGPEPKHRQDFGASVRSKLFEFRRLVTRALKPDK